MAVWFVLPRLRSPRLRPAFRFVIFQGDPHFVLVAFTIFCISLFLVARSEKLTIKQTAVYPNTSHLWTYNKNSGSFHHLPFQFRNSLFSFALVSTGKLGSKMFPFKTFVCGYYSAVTSHGQSEDGVTTNILFRRFPLGASTWVLASPLNNGPVLMIACFARGFAFAEKKNSRQRNKNHAALYLRSNCFKQWCRALQQGTFG